MNLQAPAVKNVIIDDCFQPLLKRFYHQSYKQEDFDLLNQGLMDSSSVKKHESLVGIYHLYLANRGLIHKIITSSLLFKLIYYLKEEQFPQLCFEAVRILFYTVESRKISQHLVNKGGVYSLLNLVRQENNRIIIGLSLWTLAKVANNVSGDNISAKVGINEFIEIAEDPARTNLANAIITHLLVSLWKNNILLRPEDVNRFHSFVLAQIVKVNVADEAVIKDCFNLLNARWEDMVITISAKHWKKLKKVLANLQNQPIEILKHYLHFLLKILVKIKTVVFREILITLDVFKIFQPLLSHPEQPTRLQFCRLVEQIMLSQSLLPLKYFLGKSSMLIKFYYMVESDTPAIKKQICFIFGSLTSFPSEQVLQLYEDAKIVAIYFRILKEQQTPDLVHTCIGSMIAILRFAEKMSLTTFNWFLNYLKTQKIEETIDKIEDETTQDKIKKQIPILRQYFAEKIIEE